MTGIALDKKLSQVVKTAKSLQFNNAVGWRIGRFCVRGWFKSDCSESICEISGMSAAACGG
jgi:hypothetical protein